MNVKRVLATVLCLMLVLSCVPAMNLIPEAQAAEAQVTRIEAEDTTYAVWNKYTAQDTSDVGYSGGKAAGTMQNGTYPAFDVADTTEDLATGFIDKSNVPYVAFYVDVPVAGTYSLTTASYFKFHSACDNAFAVFLVNPHDSRQETVSYKGHYGAVAATTNTYKATQPVEAYLQEGRNVIYIVAATKDDDQNVNWTNVDYLEITGDYQVTAVASNLQTLYAGDAPYVYGYATINAGGSIGGGSWGTESLMDTSNGQSVNKTRPISEMNAENARTLRGFTYTVNAPADGYYDITVSFNSMTAGDDSKAIGFLVDGMAQAREFVFNAGGNKTKGYIDLSVYLTEGDHVLTITAPANRTSAETANNSDWCDYAELLLYGGLTQSVIQSNPNLDWWYAEAEYQAEGYMTWHGFASEGDTSRAETYRDYNNSNYADYQSANTIGGSNAVNNYTLAQYQEGRLDKATAAAVTMYVEAEQAGTYSFYARYYLKAPGIWDSTNTTWTTAPFGVFMVNGDFGAQAMFNPLTAGTDRTTGNTDVVELTLKQGLNEITFIPLPKDNWKSTSDWCTMDCIFVDTALQVAKVPTGSVAVNPGKGISYLYTNNVTALDEDAATSFTYGNFDIANSENLSAAAITQEDLYKLCFVSYTVEAPYDGYYDISMVYGSSGSNTMADYAFALLVDNQTSGVKHLANDGAGTVDISTYLTKGIHTLTLTNILPIDAERAEAKDMYWTNMGEVTFNGGLALAETQINPLLKDMTVLEAETFTTKAQYNTTTSLWFASGGQGVGGADGSTITTDQVKQHLPASGQPYVEYIVEAPAEGSYEIKLGVRPSFASGVDKIIYVQVNGTILEVPFNATNTSKYACFCLPLNVELAAGRNVIRVLSPTATQTSSSWIDQDYLAVPDTVKGIVPADAVQTRPALAAYKGNYNNRNDGADNDRLDNCVVSQIALTELSEENFRKASWHSLTVNAPAAGYYPVRVTVVIPAVDTPTLGQIGVLANGEVYTAKLWQSTNVTVVAEAFVYLNEGVNDLIFTGILADSNVQPNPSNTSEYWMDAEYVHLLGGLSVADTQRYPVEGLVDGSAYSLSEGVISKVWHQTTVGELKSNFFGEVTVTSGGSVLADSAVVPSGAVVSYDSGTQYTVSTYNRGDTDGNGVIDIRDLKAAQEFIIGNLTEKNWLTDIIIDFVINNLDVEEYKDIIFGGDADHLTYQPHSIGADEILELCNPVGRLLNYRSAVFMESSASGFTMTGKLKGDVVIALRAEMGKSDGSTACIYVEVDGELYGTYPFTVNTDQKITIVKDLPAGDHTIKITKGTDAKYDSIYVYSLSYNGTLKETASAAHSIEFLGDSITVGFGLYDESSTMSGSYYSYANVAADLLGADHYTIGNGAWRFGENTGAAGDTRYLGYIYEKNSMNLSLGAYDFAWQPEVIVINLGTNDANQYTLADNGGEQDQAVFTADMAALLDMVRAHNPSARIFWIYGAMEDVTTIDKSIILPLITNAIDAYNSGKTEAMQVTYIHVDNASDGVGNHPTRAQQATIGQTVAAYIDDVMGWNLVD